jgi:hypothetical protein
VFAIKFFGPSEVRLDQDKAEIPDDLGPLLEEASPTKTMASAAVLEFVIET